MINKNGYVYHAMVISSDIPIGPLHPQEAPVRTTERMTFIPASIRPASTCEKPVVTLVVSSSTRGVAKIILWLCLRIGYPKFHGSENHVPPEIAIWGVYPIFRRTHMMTVTLTLQELVSCSLSSVEQEKKWQTDVNLMSFSGFTDT